MSEIVCFSYRKPELPEGSNLGGRVQIFEKLRYRDIAPVVSLGAESAFIGDTVSVHSLQGEHETSAIDPIELGAVRTIVNRLDRSIKKDQLPHSELLPPMINENTTRSLAFRKHRTDREVLAPLGINIPSVLAADSSTVEAFMSTQPSGRFVVKPDSGANGQGVHVLSPAGVAELFREHPDLYGTQLVQPAYDLTRPFPAGLRPYDAASAEAFEGWNRHGITKELRVYGFHSPERTTVFPVARAIHEQRDEWFFLDPETVPAHLLKDTEAAMRLAASVSGAAAMLGTVDYGYGAPAGQDPVWAAVELNGKAPYVLGYEKHYQIADTLRTMFADQIAETAAFAKGVD